MTQTAQYEIIAEQVTVFTCADGEKFNSQEEAMAHNAELKQQAEAAAFEAAVALKLEAYLNMNGIVGRARSQKENVIRLFLEWESTWDGVSTETKLDLSGEVNPIAAAEKELQQPFGDDAVEADAVLAETELDF